MEAMTAIEVTGVIEDNQLRFDVPLPVKQPTRARAIILLLDDADIDEVAWAYAASRNPAFDFLKDSGEDIYSLDDGKPFRSD
jgi:hypothetical protein